MKFIRVIKAKNTTANNIQNIWSKIEKLETRWKKEKNIDPLFNVLKDGSWQIKELLKKAKNLGFEIQDSYFQARGIGVPAISIKVSNVNFPEELKTIIDSIDKNLRIVDLHKYVHHLKTSNDYWLMKFSLTYSFEDFLSFLLQHNIPKEVVEKYSEALNNKYNEFDTFQELMMH